MVRDASPAELLSNFDQPRIAHSLNTEDKRCIGEASTNRFAILVLNDAADGARRARKSVRFRWPTCLGTNVAAKNNNSEDRA